MKKEQLNLVIVGHVDHGKSTLIGRLLYDTDSLASDKIEEIKTASRNLGRETEFSYLLDYLEEERSQGMTIDTTQAGFDTDKRHYVIIDAPGHVEFVKNMITGASSAEAAILIIDIKEGPREQTKRHAYILSLLGINQVIVAMNKMDLINYDQGKFNQVKKTTEEFLSSIKIEPVIYIPICAKSGENIARTSRNMEWYKGPILLKGLDTLSSREPLQDKPLIFPIQDVYKINDKRIAVGKIEAGCIEQGSKIKVLPSSQESEIKTIEKYLQSAKKACFGQAIGITTADCVTLSRGDIICESDRELALSDRFRANILWLLKPDFHKVETLTLRCSTQEVNCRIESIGERLDSSTLKIIQENSSVLKNLEVGVVIIKTEKPIAVKRFDDIQELGRFVLVLDDDTSAAGIITAIY